MIEFDLIPQPNDRFCIRFGTRWAGSVVVSTGLAAWESRYEYRARRGAARDLEGAVRALRAHYFGEKEDV